MNIYFNICSCCGIKNGEYCIKANGPHYGLYCDNCGQWIKWVKKNEILHLTGNENINKVFNRQGKNVGAYKALGLEEPLSLDKYVNVENITKEEKDKLDLPF